MALFRIEVAVKVTTSTNLGVIWKGYIGKPDYQHIHAKSETTMYWLWQRLKFIVATDRPYTRCQRVPFHWHRNKRMNILHLPETFSYHRRKRNPWCPHVHSDINLVLVRPHSPSNTLVDDELGQYTILMSEWWPVRNQCVRGPLYWPLTSTGPGQVSYNALNVHSRHKQRYSIVSVNCSIMLVLLQCLGESKWKHILNYTKT